jgi:AcrR family transcriptional regulator
LRFAVTLRCKVEEMPARSASAESHQRRHRPLNRDRILAGAVALIEREGPGALSMRRLGARLGVEAMSIYHHFASRDELLDAIGDRLLEPLNELELGGSWDEACRRFATALRGIAIAQPSAFRLLGLEPFDTPSALRPVERLLGVLVTEGFSPAQALAIYRATVSYARGYALAEATGFTVDAAQAAGRRRLRALPRGEFPILAGRVKELASLEADAGFELGLRALLAGVADPRVLREAGSAEPRARGRRR